MAEGLNGIFKDFENNFSCSTIDEWREHLANTETTHKGNTECVTCGNQTTYEWTGKLKNGRLYPNVLCEDCKSQ